MAFYLLPSNSLIRFVSAPCSSGKTYAACQYIADHQNSANQLYVAPSIDLLKQTLKQLTVFGVDAHAITCETNPKHVKSQIVRFLKATSDIDGAVLLITWNAFIDLPYFHRRENWTVIFDEVPQVDRFFPLMLPHNYEVLAEHLQPFPTNNSALSLIKPRNPYKLKRLLDSVHDDVHQVFRPLFKAVLSAHSEVYGDPESWDRIVDRRDISKQDEQNTVYFLSMLRPDPFADAILLGANIEDGLLFSWFRKKNVHFEPANKIADKLRELPSDLGQRVRISYFIFGRNFSKHMGKKEALNGGTVLDNMDALALEAFGQEPFLYVSNNDRNSDVLNDASNGKKISIISHGLNNLQGYHNIYFAAALNRHPKHFAMLRSLGLSPEIVHRATAHEVAYQVAMRTSLRNPESKEKVHVIVPDQPSAERLGDLLGCGNIQQIGNLLPPPIRPLSRTDKSRRYQLARMKESLCVRQDIPTSSINESGMGSRTFNTEPANLSCVVTFHKYPYERDSKGFLANHYDLHEFIGLLGTMAKTKINSKEELFLWNPAIYDPTRREGYRTQANFIQSSFLVLDFDNGSLSPPAFENIFWKQARRGRRHSFIICNTFSRSPDKPNKFRVIFFYLHPARSIEEHRAVYEYVLGRLEECGHTEKSSQLDPACKSGVQSFWIPCTNRAHPESAFFRTFGTRTRDLERCAIDPQMCLRQPRGESPQSISTGTIQTDLLAEIEKAESDLTRMTSGRNRPFFDYGILLARAGLGRDEIELKLGKIAGFERKMRRKITGILKSLSKYGWLED